MLGAREKVDDRSRPLNWRSVEDILALIILDTFRPLVASSTSLPSSPKPPFQGCAPIRPKRLLSRGANTTKGGFI